MATCTSQLMLYTHFCASLLNGIVWYFLGFTAVTSRGLLGFFSTGASIVAAMRTVVLECIRLCTVPYCWSFSLLLPQPHD